MTTNIFTRIFDKRNIGQKAALALAFLIAPALAVPSPKPVQSKPADTQAKELSSEAARRLKEIADKIFEIKWKGKVYAASSRGFDVLTDTVMTLSNRPSGNAYFVQNLKASLSEPGFRGRDEEYIRRGRRILSALDIDLSEISDIKILQHFTQAGFYDHVNKTSKLEKPKKDRRTLLITRAIHGIPIWNSRLMLDLDHKGRIDMFELSWPKIDAKVIKNAFELQKISRENYSPPELKFTQPESVAAGILHSPAASFFDDQVAAIRVIYRPTDEHVGKKPVAYHDASGGAIVMPRQALIRENAVPSRSGKSPLPQSK
jgi:hypothetical protein